MDPQFEGEVVNIWSFRSNRIVVDLCHQTSHQIRFMATAENIAALDRRRRPSLQDMPAPECEVDPERSCAIPRQLQGTAMPRGLCQQSVDGEERECI